MTSTASFGESSPHPTPATPCRAQTASPGAPAQIRVHFPAIDLACGCARYRIAPIELVAHLLPETRPQRADSGFPIPHSALRIPHSGYSLRKGLRVWHLVFNGQEAVLHHERGLWYIAWLLYHPPEQPIHAVDLAAKIPELYRAQSALNQLADPTTGRAAPLESHARLQERSLALEDAQSLRALQRKARELEAILDDDSESEPVKAEASRELEALYAFQRQHSRRSLDAAGRLATNVRQAIKRTQARLAVAQDAQGAPHPVLRSFAEHLKRYLLVPSSRFTSGGNRYARSGLAGRLTYEPPPGVLWT